MITFKVGDPVQRYYSHLKGYSKNVAYIAAIWADGAVRLSDERNGYSHFYPAHINELKKSKFTNAAHKDIHKFRDLCLDIAKKRPYLLEEFTIKERIK